MLGKEFHLRPSANRSLLQNPERKVGARRDGKLLTGDNVLKQPEEPCDGLRHGVRRKFVTLTGRLRRAADLPWVLGEAGHVVVEVGSEGGGRVRGEALVAKANQPSHFGARCFVTHVFGAALLLRRRRHRLRRARVETHKNHVNAADCELGQGSAVGVRQAISFIPASQSIRSHMNVRASKKKLNRYSGTVVRVVDSNTRDSLLESARILQT